MRHPRFIAIPILLLCLGGSSPLYASPYDSVQEYKDFLRSKKSGGQPRALMHSELTDKSRTPETPTRDWAVRVSPQTNVRQLAKTLNATILGPIGSIENTYRLRFENSEEGDVARSVREKLQSASEILWFAQQKASWKIHNDAVQDPDFNDPLYKDQWHLNGAAEGGNGVDIHIREAWAKGYTGNGITVGVVDDSLEWSHPDIQPNYDAKVSFDFNDYDEDPSPAIQGQYGTDKHGTSVAGVVAAVENNGVCGVGAAYNAKVGGLRLISAPTTDSDEAQALSYKNDTIDIYSNSWGPVPRKMIAPGPLSEAAMANSIAKGRDGKGNIYVFAAGNGKQYESNVNYNGYASSMYTIAVGAVDHQGVQSYYSEPGASMLVTAPSNGDTLGITTTDLTGVNGYSQTECTDSFGGTSSATPLVSGIISLMLEANPDLTWRDVQHILVHTTQKNDPDDPDWSENGAGLHVNHKYGFGMVDADAAIAMATAPEWKTLSKEIDLAYGPVDVNAEVPDYDETGTASTIHVDHNLKLEHVEVVFTAIHPSRGDLSVVLTSPSGTKSELALARKDSKTNYLRWKFTSVRHWDETSAGDWKLTVKDNASGDVGTFNSWKLMLHGHFPEDVNQPPLVKADVSQTDRNTPVTIRPLSNDLDLNGDALSITEVETPSNGVATITENGTAIQYTPASDYAGMERFTYTVSDGELTAKGEISVAVGGQETVFATEETGVPIPDKNDQGVTSSIHVRRAGMFMGARLKLNIKHSYVNDLKATLISPAGTRIPLFNRLQGLVDGNFGKGDFVDTVFDDNVELKIIEGAPPFTDSYRPVVPLKSLYGEAVYGEWKLEVADMVSVAEGVLEDWELTLLFAPISGNTAPVATDDAVEVFKNSVLVKVLQNDFDYNGDAISLSGITQPAHGKAEILEEDQVRYTPDADYAGNDAFTYTVTDGELETTATVSITVKGNRPPVARSDISSTAVNKPIDVKVLDNDTDPDMDPITITRVVAKTASGTAEILTGKKVIRYTPASGFTGVDRFTYTVSDGITSTEAELEISVGEGKLSYPHTEDPALIIPDDDPNGVRSVIHVPAGGVVQDIDVTLNIRHDFNRDLRAELISPSGTRVQLLGYVKDMLYQHHFTGTILDDEADQVIAPGGQPYTGRFRPAEPLSRLDGEPVHGDWTLFIRDEGEHIDGRLDSWTLDISLTPLSENVPPSVKDDTVHVKTGPVTIAVLENDFDFNADPLSILAVSEPASGTAVINPEKTITYTPKDGFTGKDVFTYTVSDGQANATGAVFVTVGEGKLNKYRTGDPVSIPDGDPQGVMSSLVIAEKGWVHDLNLNINLSHRWIHDLILELTSPGGTRIVLVSKAGGARYDYVNTTFDDEAAIDVVPGLAALPDNGWDDYPGPRNASYRPAEPLSRFDGESITGTWTLKVIDFEKKKAGSLGNWSLRFSYVPQSETVSLRPADPAAAADCLKVLTGISVTTPIALDHVPDNRVDAKDCIRILRKAAAMEN